MPDVRSLPSAFAEAAQRRPARLFWICVAVHCVLWIVVSTLVQPNALSDVIEGYAWGHEWPLGTNKHPPLAAWILETLAILTGRAPWAHYFASQASVAVAFWAVWQTGRRITGETGALIGALMLVGIGYYNFLIPEFNPNVLQLPFWALIGWSYHRAVKDNRTADWLLLGLWSAAGLYAKYSTLVLLAVLGVLTFVHPESRKRLLAKGPWITILVASVLMLPHIVWLVRHNFVPFIYTGQQFDLQSSAISFIVAPARLVLEQIAVCLPAVLIYAVAFRRPARPAFAAMRSFDGMFLCFVAFGPLVLTALIAVLSDSVMRGMWATPFLNFIGLWAVFFLRPPLNGVTLRRFAVSWACVFAIGITAFAAVDLFRPYVRHEAERIYFPGRALADQLTAAWHERYHTPLRYVVGDVWSAGNVGYYSSDRPHVLITGNTRERPWITPEDLNREGAEVRRDGGIMVWCRRSCPQPDPISWQPYLSYFQPAIDQPPLRLPQQSGAKLPPSMVGWAFLPPEGK